MPTRRELIGSGALLGLGAAAGIPSAMAAEPVARGFVQRQGTTFQLDGRTHRFVGANLWYGAWLGANATYGNRDRLRRELDALAALGVTNLRIAASAEDSPLKNSVKPAFRTQGSTYNPVLLDGLDFLLAEMGKCGLHAVIYLTNFWEWSGGMMTYLLWTNGGRYLDMNDPAHPWPEFPDFNTQFYQNSAAVRLYHDYVQAIVGRTNAITGRAYRDDPTIMAWQLANEPRPGGSDKALSALPAFYGWIGDTARLIKSIDANHLVSTGSEGLKGALERPEIVLAAHAAPEVDYVTAHIWPQNWSWVDPKDLAGTSEAGFAKVRDYISQHEALAAQLGKPLVIEEFGFPRDEGSFDPAARTSFKDRYYRLIYDAVEASAVVSGPLAGSNFWAWNGEGRAAHPDHRFRSGDTAWLGDPPHEPQGWYGVFSSDETTQAVVRDHAAALAKVRS